MNPLVEAIIAKSDSDTKADVQYRATLLNKLDGIERELKLLNARIEEAFDTRINCEDVEKC